MTKKSTFTLGSLLPTFSMLEFIVKFVSSGIPFIGKLSRFQEILLVLMKLRLNLEEQDLAYRFCVSQSTVSNVFRKWIYIMAEQLSFLIHWPSREQMMTSMPMVFRKFSKTAFAFWTAQKYSLSVQQICRQDHIHGVNINTTTQSSANCSNSSRNNFLYI